MQNVSCSYLVVVENIALFSFFLFCFPRMGFTYESITPLGVYTVPIHQGVLIEGSVTKVKKTTLCSVTSKYDSIIASTSQFFQVDVDLVRAIISVESCFLPTAVSEKGAKGLMQLMPSTAKRFGVKNSFDAEQNILGGIKYLRYLLDFFGGNTRFAIAAYNAGEGAVKHYRGVPPFEETRKYVAKVMSLIGAVKDGFEPLDMVALSVKRECVANSRIRKYTYLKLSGSYFRRFFVVENQTSSYSVISNKTGVSIKQLDKLNGSLSVKKKSASLRGYDVLVWECELAS